MAMKKCNGCGKDVSTAAQLWVRRRYASTIAIGLAVFLIIAGSAHAVIEPGTPTTLASGNSRFWAIALDNTHVYWTDVQNGLILKVPKNGGDVSTLASTSPNVSLAVAVFGTFVYWAEHSAVTKVGAIRMVHIDGGATTTIASSESFGGSWGAFNGIRGLAVDSSGVYWTVAGNNLGSDGMILALSGVPVDDPVLLSLTAPTVLAAGLKNPMGLSLDEDNVYWIESDCCGTGGAIRKISKLGGTPVAIASELGETAGIATDGLNVFFGIWNGSVHKVSINGGPVSNLRGFTSSQFLAIDSTSVYFTGIWGDAVGKVAKDGTGQTTLATGLEDPWGLAVDATGLYWTECPTCFPGTGAVKKLPSTGPVCDPLVADAGPDRTVRSGEFVTFDFSLSPCIDVAVDIRWDFDDGQVATGALIRHRFSEPGVYQVSLTVEDSFGTTITDTALIAVEPIRVTVAFAEVDILGFEHSARATASYVWTFDVANGPLYSVRAVGYESTGVIYAQLFILSSEGDLLTLPNGCVPLRAIAQKFVRSSTATWRPGVDVFPGSAFAMRAFFVPSAFGAHGPPIPKPQFECPSATFAPP